MVKHTGLVSFDHWSRRSLSLETLPGPQVGDKKRGGEEPPVAKDGKNSVYVADISDEEFVLLQKQLQP